MAKYADMFKAVAEGEAPLNIGDERAGAGGEPEPFTLLLVDDEEGVLNALRRNFQDENYRVLTANGAQQALSQMENQRVHLVIADHRMPGMPGAELLKEIKQRWPDTIRIMLTGYADVQAIMGAVNEGAVYKFITKPWNDEDLRLTVSLALQQYMLIQENRKLKEITRQQQVKIDNYTCLFDEDRGVLGSVLLKAGVIGQSELERAHAERSCDETVGEALVRLGITTDTKIVRALQNQLGIEYVDLKEMTLSPEAVKFLPREMCEKNRIIPVKLEGRQFTLAMADPSDIYKCDNIALMTGFKVLPLIATSSDILSQLRLVYGERKEEEGGEYEDISSFEPMEEIDVVLEEEEGEVNVQSLISSSEVPPIIRIVNAIISEAIRYKASDIHIEPKTKYSIVRYRIDGILQNKIKIPADLHAATISRVKIVAKMDIAERRKPQDGRITVKSGTRMVDLRVSTMPTINGEKVVMRILDKSSDVRRLEELGVLGDDLKKITALSKKPQGIIISTGPTGSGKTTMLYSILSAMIETSRNFETIEEPVEYFVEEANQVNIREKIGLSFASVLRSTLRQDPDVILVGEVRDEETADVAFKAALTGHMVLTTLHTNSSVASITRLMDLGVKPYLIASAMEGILAQRLVRKVCRYCKAETSPDRDLMELLKVSPEMLDGKVWLGKGCERCNSSGYLGRTGIFEIFVMNDDFRHFISSSYKEAELLNMARMAGMRTLIEDGVEKVRQGETTLEELVRVIGPQTRHERLCESCGRMIDAKFIFCPLCGAFKQNYCLTCKVPLEKDWRLCPFCGGIKEIEPEGGRSE